MAYTAVQICNIALTRVGGKRISSLSEQSENAIIANTIYNPIYEHVLASYEWHCAIRRAKLAQLSSSPEYEYDYKYQLPSSPKCLRVLSTYPEAEYKIEGQALLCNVDQIYIRYIARVDESELDSHVALVVAARLAIEFANRVAQDTALKGQLWQEFQLIELKAKNIDGKGREKDEKGEYDWIKAGWETETESEDKYLE